MQPAHKPILCYVTDRRAFDGPLQLREAMHRAARAGVDWIQIREKDLEARQLAELTRLAVSDVKKTGARVIVNDRLDVALAAGAAGIHLGESAIRVKPVAQWRRTYSRADFLVGASCHSLESAIAAESDGASYIFFGPIFATPSKASFGPPQGIEKLQEVCKAVGIPVLAIGGITMENCVAAIAAGASGIAAIRLFQDSSEVSAIVSGLRK